MDQEITATVSAIASRLSQAGRSKSGDELVALTIDQMLRSLTERQAEVLRRCALPRWIDASVLRVLREREEGNERVLEHLRTYSFVHDLGDGRLALHDEVRRALIDEWRRERPDEARTIHRRLYSYFSTRTTPPGATSRAMPLMPESTALSVVPMSTQSDLLRREALYHLLHVDPERGLEQLRRAFASHEEAHRLAEAELLVQTASEAPLGPRERRWVMFLRARALKEALRLEEAEAQLNALRERGDLEPELAAEVGRTLGSIYSKTGRWARATRLYRKSLAHFARSNNSPAVAETMLLLGEAYQGLGVSTGSWHAPIRPTNPVLRAAHALWIWLLGLPFQIVILLSGSKGSLLPLPEHCARYQNWLLIRLYNTARAWYSDARDAFRRLDDPVGLLRAEQRLADILLLYGYHQEARAAIEALMARPEARDPYRRAWLQRSLAECLLTAGDHTRASALLADAAVVFRELGDIRREASVLTLQGKAAAAAGDIARAVRDYEAGLARFRALRYDAARERILHELRDWQRQPDLDPADRERLAALVAAEPEKRYVGRFIRSYQGLLQVSTILALPLALLLMAIVSPTAIISLTEQGTLSQVIFFNPWRVFGVAATLTLIYMAVYAAIAMTVIYWLPITRIEREQPDQIVTTPDHIARYDSRGHLALAMPWSSVRRWLALDRCLWERPLSLYSRSYLEDEQGNDLVIDGITGWYTELQDDIGWRLAAAGNPVPRNDLGYSILRSRLGLSAAIGAVLLVAVTWSNNGWFNLGGLFPPPLAAAIWFLALSGALMLAPLAYWIVNRPLKLQRALVLNERWPLFLAAIGGAAVGAYLLLGGRLIPVEALNYSTFVWGAYVLAEALAALAAPGRRAVRLAAVTATTALALALVATPALAHFRWLEGYIARKQVESGVMAAAASCGAAEQARALGDDPYSTWAIQADCAAAVGDWTTAARYYRAAAESAPNGSSDQALALYNLWVAAGRTNDHNLRAQAIEAYRSVCAGIPNAPVCAIAPAQAP